MPQRLRSRNLAVRSGPRHRPWTIQRQGRWIRDLCERLNEARDDGERAYLLTAIEREMAYLEYMKEMGYA